MKAVDFINFCQKPECNVVTEDLGKDKNLIIRKTQITKHIWLLETHYQYGEQRILVGGKTDIFEYAGFYHSTTKKVYNAPYELTRIFTELENEPACFVHEDARAIAFDMENKLGEAVTAMLPYPTEESIENAISRDNGVSNAAMDAFLDGMTSESYRAQACKVLINLYYTNELNDFDMDAFLTDANSWAKSLAVIWLADHDHRESAENSFAFFEAKTRELQKLEADTSGRHHLIRNIQQIAKSDCKTVMVTIDKDGKVFTGKVEAKELRSPCGTYFEFIFVRKDRGAYLSLYGRNKFTVKDIVSITYGRKTLYERKKPNAT